MDNLPIFLNSFDIQLNISNFARPLKTSRKLNKILIVDDIGYNIQALKIILKYSVKLDVETICDHATDGQEAFDVLKKDVEEINNS